MWPLNSHPDISQGEKKKAQNSYKFYPAMNTTKQQKIVK